MNAILTRFLARVLGRMPIGWLQLSHSRNRLLAAVVGVTFADVLVCVQLGILGALNVATEKPYLLLNTDVLISAGDSNSFSDGSNVARQWMFRALEDPDVVAAVPFYMGNLTWDNDGTSMSLLAFGVDPGAPDFLSEEIRRIVRSIRLPNAVLLDSGTRNLPEALAAGIRPSRPLSFEAKGKTLTAYDTFDSGGGFSSDGFVVMSDQTFLGLFGARSSSAPDHILLRVAEGADPDLVATRVADTIDGADLKVRSYAQAVRDDQIYQNTMRPTGVIFGFGVLIGILVGIVIVYQVLSTDVADHLGEYATFKAMGYRPGFFLGVVFEEAVILGILGFIPGVITAKLAMAGLSSQTGLPFILHTEIAIAVFVGTVLACLLSGAIATRRLAAADPAELF